MQHTIEINGKVIPFSIYQRLVANGGGDVINLPPWKCSCGMVNSAACLYCGSSKCGKPRHDFEPMLDAMEAEQIKADYGHSTD